MKQELVFCQIHPDIMIDDYLFPAELRACIDAGSCEFSFNSYGEFYGWMENVVKGINSIRGYSAFWDIHPTYYTGFEPLQREYYSPNDVVYLCIDYDNYAYDYFFGFVVGFSCRF